MPGLATVATAATVLTAPSEVPGGLGEFDRVRWIVLSFFILIGSVLLIF